MVIDDRTAKARIRDAAIEMVVESGAASLTARGVAERADVSLGLIRHHFGSMAKLLTACDEHVAARVREGKEAAIQQGTGFDALSAVRATGSDHVMGYLAMRLGDDSPELDALVDSMIDDACGYIAAGVEAGMLTPSSDEAARAAMLTLYALGSLALHKHLSRHFGLDLRAVDLASQPGFARYVRVQMELFSSMVEPPVLEQYAHILTALEEQS